MGRSMLEQFKYSTTSFMCCQGAGCCFLPSEDEEVVGGNLAAAAHGYSQMI